MIFWLVGGGENYSLKVNEVVVFINEASIEEKKIYVKILDFRWFKVAA